MTEPITRGALGCLRNTSDPARKALFVASTDVSDRADDIVDQSSWKLDNYRANPLVLVDHDYRTTSTVGRGAVEVVEGVGLQLEVVGWSRKPLGVATQQDVEDGILNAVSVGFRPGRSVARKALPTEHPWYKAEGWGYVYYDCELLEISICTVPMNPEALAVRSAQRIDAGEIAEMLIDHLARDPASRGMLADVLADPPTDLTALYDSPGDLAALFPPESTP